MPANLNVSLAGAVLQVVNTVDSTTRVNSSQGNPTLGASESTYIDFLPIALAGTALPLPAATIWFLVIRNLGGINGTPAGTITVRQQVTGGALVAAADSPIILANGIHAYINVAETAGGVIAVTLIASVANTPVEILMAA